MFFRFAKEIINRNNINITGLHLTKFNRREKSGKQNFTIHIQQPVKLGKDNFYNKKYTNK